MDMNRGLHSEKPANKCLSYGMALNFSIHSDSA
jgi:hypothetical protein